MVCVCVMKDVFQLLAPAQSVLSGLKAVSVFISHLTFILDFLCRTLSLGLNTSLSVLFVLYYLCHDGSLRSSYALDFNLVLIKDS